MIDAATAPPMTRVEALDYIEALIAVLESRAESLREEVDGGGDISV